MALSGRFVMLALLGLAPVLLLPGWWTVLAVVLALAALLALELGLAASLRGIDIQRSEPGNVALNSPAISGLTVRNNGRRRLRATIRDAWQPSAGAQNAVQEVEVPSGESRRVTVRLRPVRRGDLGSPHVTLRSSGPLLLAARQRTLTCPGSLRVLPPFNSRRHIPSKLRR
jgi:uncharacterized protein (DUF58 family)